MGPLISPEAKARVERLIQSSVDQVLTYARPRLQPTAMYSVLSWAARCNMYVWYVSHRVVRP